YLPCLRPSIRSFGRPVPCPSGFPRGAFAEWQVTGLVPAGLHGRNERIGLRPRAGSWYCAPAGLENPRTTLAKGAVVAHPLFFRTLSCPADLPALRLGDLLELHSRLRTGRRPLSGAAAGPDHPGGDAAGELGGPARQSQYRGADGGGPRLGRHRDD